MKFDDANNAPEDINEYEVLKHQETRDKFVPHLVAALRQGALNLTTGEDIPVPIGWVDEAVEFARPKNYQITMKRVEANDGDTGTGHGIFYFKKLPAN